MIYHRKNDDFDGSNAQDTHLSFISNIKKRFLFKFISLLVVGIFAYQQIVWAQGATPVLQKPLNNSNQNIQKSITPEKIKLPYDLVQKNELHVNEKGDEVVIHLQDAHASLSAQYSIVELLDLLASNYDLNFVALEGAEGVIDTSVLSTFPDDKVKNETATLLMKEGRLGAAEFFDITRNNTDVALYGIEDSELYQQNLKSFRSVVDTQAEALHNINSLVEQITDIEKKNLF